jgi:hypothetical protein
MRAKRAAEKLAQRVSRLIDVRQGDELKAVARPIG